MSLVLWLAELMGAAHALQVATTTANLTSTLTVNAPLPSGAAYINWTLAQISETLPPIYTANEDLSACVCDLTVNECDVNCCCDPDCVTLYGILGSNYKCVMDASMKSSNNPSIVKTCSGLLTLVNPLGNSGMKSEHDLDSNQLCVVINNSPLKGYFYSDPGSRYQSDSFFSSQIQMKPFSFGTNSYDVVSPIPLSAGTTQPAVLLRNYSIGDLLVVAYTDVPLYGTFPLPAVSTSGECDDSNPAKYLISESNACVRQVPAGFAPALCTSASVLDVSYYLSGYQFVANAATNISLATLTCMNLQGATVACSTITPYWNTTSATCSNVITSLQFNFTYTTQNGSIQISGVSANTQFGQFQFSDAATAVMQKFSIAWSPANVQPVPKSGNPGYILGKPVLFGSLIQLPIPAVAYFASQKDALTLPRDVYSGGFLGCTGLVTDRLGVNFGEDVETGCTLYFSYSDMQDCATVRDAAYAAVAGAAAGASKVDLINLVGKWGNSSVEVVEQWVPILQRSLGDASKPPTSPGTCSSVLTSLTIEFLTSKMGVSSNPQTAIVAARVTKTWGSFSYRCMTPNDCRAVNGIYQNRKQRFRVKAAVSFMDVGLAASPFVPPAPRLVPLLPDDIFYPFSLPG
ncbi:hypothetical protein BC830DRAFT_189973 [Chytriomyces sp. MP71]|nr:hypothetical protein BC830DRAFT_189973 [Chytriomyces sp. MP71]